MLELNQMLEYRKENAELDTFLSFGYLYTDSEILFNIARIASGELVTKSFSLKFFAKDVALSLLNLRMLADNLKNEANVTDLLQGIKGKTSGKIITKSEGLNNAIHYGADMGLRRGFINFADIVIKTLCEKYESIHIAKGIEKHEFLGTTVTKTRNDVAYTETILAYAVDYLTLNTPREFNRFAEGGQIREMLALIDVYPTFAKKTKEEKTKTAKENGNDEFSLDDM